MTEIRVDLEVLCKCGDDLKFSNRNASQIEVEPCQRCLDESYEDGRGDGKVEAENG